MEMPSLPGVYTQGETRDEALERAKEAIEVFLDSLADEGKQPQPVQHGRVAVSPTAAGERAASGGQAARVDPRPRTTRLANDPHPR